MTWTNDQRLHSLRFDPDGTKGPIVFGGMTTASIAGNPEVLAEISAGSIYPGAASLQVLRPVLTFTSFDLNGLWGTDGPGLNGGNDSCVHGDVDVGLELFYALYECAGPSDAGTGTPHTKYTISEGIIVPSNFTVDHRGDAQMTYEVFMIDDTGSGAPLVKARVATSALPTITNNNLRWTMDKMTMTLEGGGSVDVEGKRNISIAFNSSITQEGADSTTFDSVASLDSMRPRVTIQGVEPDWLDDASSPAAAITDVNGHTVVRATTIIYLRERNAAASAISLAFDGLVNWDTIVSGGPESPAEATINVDVTEPSPGAGAFVINTAATIP